MHDQSKQLVAIASTTIQSSPDRVWKALTDPEKIRQYMFGADVITDWKVGSPIVWKGVFDGMEYEDKGRILKFEPEKVLRMTHYSPLSGEKDIPENYHTLTIELSKQNENATRVELTQDNNPSEKAREHSEKNWQGMLEGLKAVVEKV